MSPLKVGSTSPARRLRTSVALLCLGFASLVAQPVQTQTQTPQPDALTFFKNYFITGSYVVGGVGLQGRGVNGVATGSIPMTGAPEGADIVAAFLYWQVVTKDGTGDAGASGVTFGPWAPSAPTAPGPGIPLSSEDGALGKILGTGTPPCWSGGGGTGSSGGATKTFTYRTDILRFLRIDETTGKYKVNGAYQVQLPDGNGVTALGASLVVIYRDLAKPLNAIVLYDGAYTMDQSTEGMFQSIKGFYDGGASAKLTHIVGSGQANKSEILRFNGATVATNPFRSSAGPGWDNQTYTVDANGAALVGLPTEVTTSVDHEGFSSFDCLTWAAVVYETPVKDTDGDGLLDAWETSSNLVDPNGQPLPNLAAMDASPFHKDVFIEIGYMKSDVPTSYGGGAAKDPHSHLPTPAAIKLMGDAFKNAPVANPDGTNGIRLHVDVGASEEYQTGEASQYIVPAALARGGEALDESITTAGCTRVPGVDSVWSCQFSEYPGTVGWKSGFRYIRDEVIGTTDGSPVPPPPASPEDDDPCDAIGSTCVKRFDANRSDMFHYAFFAHAVGMPKSLNACLDEGGAEVPDVDGHCPAGTTENPLFFTPRTNSGIADFPGRDILVTLGAFSDRYGLPGGTDFMVASTFFHELGHNIELRHGAWQETPGGPVLPAPNCVPTYLSSMNYLYQLRGLLDDSGKPHLDFSSASGPNLTEAGGQDKEFSFKYRIGWYAPLAGSYFAYPDPADPTRILSRTSVAGRHCDGSLMFSNDPLMVRVDATAKQGVIDWNANGIPDGYVAQDLNFNGRTEPLGSPELPTAFNDWANIRLNQIGAGRNVGGPFIDADGFRAFGPLSADLARADWARADWARADWARADWARADWARADWARADWGDLSQGDLNRYGLARADWARADWARADWARADWARADWGRGDDGRGDLGGGDLFVGNPNIAAGELDHETATLLANTPPYEFSVCIGGADGCGEGLGVRAEWTAPNEGGVHRYIVYRVQGTKLEPGQQWTAVGEIADTPGQVVPYWVVDDDLLVKGEDYLYFAVAVYQREIEGTLQDVQSDPSNFSNIKGPNHAPTASPQSVSAAEDTSAAITLTGSDTDAGDALTLTYAVTVAPEHGTLSGTAPNLTYTPALNYYGSDSFTFTVSDGAATSAAATVSITVGAVNDAPAAAGQSVTTLEDTPKVITLTGADVDGDALASYTVTTPPAHGTLSGSAPNLTYTPALNYNGPDSFAFTVSDGTATSAAAAVNITVTAVNDAPVPVNDTYPMPWPLGTPLTVSVPGVLGNDTDVEGGALQAILVGGPSKGTLSLASNGSFTYAPGPTISGSDSFTYRVSDGSATSTSAATVRIVAYSLIGIQNVPPAVVTKSKAGSTVPMKWQFKDGPQVVSSSGVHHTVTVKGTTTTYTVSDTDSGSSSFRYDTTTNTWTFNLQTKNASGVPYPVGDYQVTITPTTPGFLPSPSFKLTLTK